MFISFLVVASVFGHFSDLTSLLPSSFHSIHCLSFCSIMARRTKRTAASIAESKIRKVHEDESVADDKKPRAQDTTTATGVAVSKKQKRASSGVFDFDDVLPPSKKRRQSRKKSAKRRSVKPQQRNEHRYKGPSGFPSLDDLKFSPLGSLASSLSSASGIDNGATVLLEFNTAEKARMEHLLRRRRRSVNSVGPMLLSYRTSYRMSKGGTVSASSPIVSTRLRFTPVAHLPTTPAFKSRAPLYKSSAQKVASDLRSRI